MLIPALLGGVFVGVLSALPFVNIANCCCLWVVSGGALSSWLLQQESTEPIGWTRGASVGLLAGVVGAFAWLVVTIMLDPLLVPFQQQMLRSIAPNVSDMPPQVRELLDSMSDPGSAPMRWATGFVGQLFVGVVFSTLGGVIGSALVQPSTRATASPPPPPPAPPPPLPPVEG
jgi:hypothetical protein